MEYLHSFISNIHEFYAHVEKQATAFEELLTKSVKPCSAITNQCLILNSAISKESLEGTGLEDLPKFKDLLINSILSSLKKELDLLLEIRDNLVPLINDLGQKQTLVEESFKKVQDSGLDYITILNPISPRVEYIVDWSLDVWRYYHALFLQITISLENLKFEDADSVASLVGGFKENEKLKEKVNKIRRFELHLFPFIK